MKFIVSIFLLFTGIITVNAQCPGSSPFWGLNCFLNSDFILKYEEARSRAEQSVYDFKSLAEIEKFSEDDVQRVMDAYNASANRFNDILYKVKEDLLDRKRRKVIIKQPDAYALEMEKELNKASKFYADHYSRAVAEITGGRVQTVAFLTLLPEIIKYAKIGIALFQKVKKEIRQYNEGIMEKHLIQPYRFHSWNEIA